MVVNSWLRTKIPFVLQLCLEYFDLVFNLQKAQIKVNFQAQHYTCWKEWCQNNANLYVELKVTLAEANMPILSKKQLGYCNSFFFFNYTQVRKLRSQRKKNVWITFVTYMNGLLAQPERI